MQSITASEAEVKSLPVCRDQRPIFSRDRSSSHSFWYGKKPKRSISSLAFMRTSFQWQRALLVRFEAAERLDDRFHHRGFVSRLVAGHPPAFHKTRVDPSSHAEFPFRAF